MISQIDDIFLCFQYYIAQFLDLLIFYLFLHYLTPFKTFTECVRHHPGFYNHLFCKIKIRWVSAYRKICRCTKFGSWTNTIITYFSYIWIPFNISPVFLNLFTFFVICYYLFIYLFFAFQEPLLVCFLDCKQFLCVSNYFSKQQLRKLSSLRYVKCILVVSLLTSHCTFSSWIFSPIVMIIVYSFQNTSSESKWIIWC